MSWRDRMVTASFRGFEFPTDSHDAKGGNRIAVKQYSGGDIPDSEDMGAKAGEWRLNAYFIGPDYDLERNGFIAKLNEHGADWLNHPWLGLLWVRVRDWSLHESNDKGGFCTITIDFVPGGSSQQPTQDKVDQAIERIQALRQVAVDEFTLEPMSAPAMTSLIASVQAQLDRVRDVVAIASLPLTMVNQLRGLVDSIKSEAAALLALPNSYAAALNSLSGLLGSGPDIAKTTSAATASTSIPQVVTSLTSLTHQPVPVLGGVGDSPALRINLSREADLRGQLLLTSAAQIALTDYRTANERDTALASVLVAMDRMLPTMSDAVFHATLDCRAALIDALLAQQLEPAVERDILNPLPATLLAHRMQVDEATFLAQNHVSHPLFVSGRVYG